MIIALVGSDNCGKQLVARSLTTYGCQHLSFSEPKRKALIAMGIPSHIVTNPSMEVEDVSKHVRISGSFLLKSFNNWATELVGSHLWIDLLQNQLEQSDSDNFVIDDLCTLAELRMLYTYKGELTVVYIREQDRPANAYPMNVATELASKPNMTIINDLTEQGSHIAVAAYLANWLGLTRVI